MELFGASRAATRATVAPFLGPSPVSTTSVARVPTMMATLGNPVISSDMSGNLGSGFAQYRLSHVRDLSGGREREQCQSGDERLHGESAFTTAALNAATAS